MTVLTQPPGMGDVLKYELNPNYTRETITLLEGTNYPLGSVLGHITLSGKYTLASHGGSDGAETAAAVLLYPVDARLSDAVGVVLDAINDSGVADNTVVIFTSDNGGHPEYASNAPFRGSKWNLYEGGIRVPFVMRWPKRLPSGQTSNVPVVGYDLLPTLCAAVGVSQGSDDIDGQDIFALLEDPVAANNRKIVWHFPFYHPETGYARAKPNIGYADFRVSQTRPHSAIRQGKHKLM